MGDKPEERSYNTRAEMMLRAGLLDEATLRRLLEGGIPQGAFLQKLEQMRVIKEEDLVEFLSNFHSVTTVPLDDMGIPDEDIIRSIPKHWCEKHNVVPIARGSDSLIVAFADPGNVKVFDDMISVAGMPIEMVVASGRAIKDAIERFYESLEKNSLSDGLRPHLDEIEQSGEYDQADPEDQGLLERSSEAKPVVAIVDMLLTDAIKRGASDIHIEPFEDRVRVRFRIDGVMQEIETLPEYLKAQLVSRIKIMSELNIAERRLPQDGRMPYTIPETKRECDFRVSIAPFAHGEKAVLRLLDRKNLQTDMSKLGFEPEDYKRFKQAVHAPWGMVLVTGPTGSGKTTTLYSALMDLNKISENICTAEDPIEFELNGISQMQMNDDIGLNFEKALRSFLRQDPDIILVGEIRDYETAEIAIKAALTGHMVLSTLHTNDAPSTITRLTNIGVEGHMVNSAVRLVVAQRLVRRNCLHCLTEESWKKDDCIAAGMTEEDFENATTKSGSGCRHCSGTGYRGRVALYEVMPMSSPIKEAINNGLSAAELSEIAIKEGMQTLRQAGLKKFAQGLTTLEEVLRVS